MSFWSNRGSRPWLLWLALCTLGAGLVLILALRLALLNGVLLSLNGTGTLLVRDPVRGWRPIVSSDSGQALSLQEHQTTEGLLLESVQLKRRFASKVWVLQVDPSVFSFRSAFTADLQPSSAREIARLEDLAFVVNANLFLDDGMPIGWVVRRGKVVSEAIGNPSGACTVWEDEVVRCGVYPSERDSRVSEAVQAFPLLSSESERDSPPDQPDRSPLDVDYRVIVGMRHNGMIAFLLPTPGLGLGLKEATRLSAALGIEDAFMFDGGRSAQYWLKVGDIRLAFSASRRRVPVFWGAQRRPPQS